MEPGNVRYAGTVFATRIEIAISQKDFCVNSNISGASIGISRSRRFEVGYCFQLGSAQVVHDPVPELLNQAARQH